MKPTKKLQQIKQIKLSFLQTLFAILVVLVIFSPSWAATYYVDANNGNDSNTGTSEAAPWKTIAKVNVSTFNPADQILFKRGEIWKEQLIVPSSGSSGNPITFGAYGNGNKPIISGADLVAEWSATNISSVWKAKLRIIAYSDPFRTVIPIHSGHRFQSIPDSDSDPFRTPIPIHFGQ